MKIATRLVGKRLEKFARQAEAKGARTVLAALGAAEFAIRQVAHPAPDEIGSPAEIHDAARETFIHRHERLAGERIARMKARAVTTDAALVAQRGRERPPEREAAVLDRVMRVHFEIALAMQFEIHDRMLCEQGEHVVEERHAGFHCGTPLAIEPQLDGHARLFRDAFEGGLTDFHVAKT